MRHIKEIFGGDLRQFGMLIALIALITFFHIWSDGRVITPGNAMNIINGNSYILILAIGMVLVIIAGNIDLSVGSVAAFAGIVVALAMRDFGLPWWAGILLCLAVGALAGVWQGFWVSYVGIPAFIVTLAGMLIFRGANQFVGKSNSVPVPEEIRFLGGGYLPEVGPQTGYNNLTMLLGLLVIVALVIGEVMKRRAQRRIDAEVAPLWVSVVKMGLLAAIIYGCTYLFATGRPGTSFPIPGLILVVLVLVYWFISSRTVFGRHIYAFGGNREAAALSGVNTKFVNFLVMMNMSVLAALAGLIFIGRSQASGPADGNMWELDAIAAVFIGGAAVSVGVGTVVGALIGGLVMAVLNNGLQLLGVGADATQMIKGLVLLLAVAFDVWNKTQGKPSITGLIFRSKPKSDAPKNPAPPAEEATEPSRANA